MAINYFQGNNDNLGPLASVGIDDDSATAWWGGAQKCFASIALAAVLATTALATEVAQTVALERDDFAASPQTNQQDDDSWQNPVPAVAASHYVLLPLGDQDDVYPTTPATINTDEDFWTNAVPPVAAANSWPQQWAFDVQESAGSLFGQYDEDFWRSGVAAVWWTNLYPQQSAFDSQEPVLFGQYDEDFWKNPVVPVAGNLYHSPLLGDQEEIPGTLLFGQPPEEYWQNPSPPVAATLYQSLPYLFESADFVPLIVPEFDEDFWQNPVAPVQASLYRPTVFRDPEEVPAGSLLKSQAVDEYYWQNWAQLVASALYQRLPYLFDPVENGFAQSGTALPAGLSLVAEEHDPTASIQTAQPGGSLPARRGRARGGFSSGPPPIPLPNVFAIARPSGLSLRVEQGKVSASGSAHTAVAVPALRIGAGQPTAKGIRNPTDEELIAILMGA